MAFTNKMTTGSISGTLEKVQAMYDFIDRHIEHEDSSFNIEASPAQRQVMLIADNCEFDKCSYDFVVLDSLVGVTEERTREIVHEWYACLKWLHTLTACIITEEDSEFTGVQSQFIVKLHGAHGELLIDEAFPTTDIEEVQAAMENIDGKLAELVEETSELKGEHRYICQETPTTWHCSCGEWHPKTFPH